MYCPTCGSNNDDGAKFCRACGGSLTPETQDGPPPHVPNHLVWAILVTIFCCLPFGIVSIVYAAQVNGFVAEGRLDSARQASENAKMWAWIAFAVGLVSLGGFGVFSLGNGINLL
ncbi:MAG: CD225/dispanin family protein [Chloroflexi bacterium]|nr:CD225/dispanin family protein [Chloroflexota bacterium]